MANEIKQRMIALLEEDAAHMREAAEAWEELQKHNARLEDLNGKLVGTAKDMAADYRKKEKELRNLLAKVKAL